MSHLTEQLAKTKAGRDVSRTSSSQSCAQKCGSSAFPSVEIPSLAAAITARRSSLRKSEESLGDGEIRTQRAGTVHFDRKYQAVLRSTVFTSVRDR